MKSPPPVKDSSRPRGRPRSAEARRAIFKATHELLAEGGLSSVTIEGIAARAGVGKPTIYRSWPNAHAVAMAALMESDIEPATRRPQPPATPGLATPSGSAALALLRAQLHEVVRVFSAPQGRNVAMMIAAAEPDTELARAFRNHFILARRSEGRGFLTSAMANGEIRRDLNIDIALDLIYAPVFYRVLMGHAALDEQFIDEVLNLALEGLGGAD